MKKTFKLCSLILSVCLAFGCIFSFAACGEPAPAEHTHTFAATWESNADYHWHKATCEHTTEVSAKAKHTFVGDKCSTCNYERPHTHTFATTWSYDEHTHWYAATCGHNTEKKDEAAHTFVGNKCSVCDYEKQVEKTAKCDIYCPVCGKCMDVRCTQDAADDKCGAGNKSFVFEAEYCEWYDPAGGEPDVIDRTGQPAKGDCVFVQSLQGGNGKILTFTITADADMTVSLLITASTHGRVTVFTDQMTVVVNGDVLTRSSTVPAYDPNTCPANEEKRDFHTTNLGCIQLTAGENVIDIIAFSPDASVGYNMDKIELLAPSTASLTWNPIIRQES